MFERLPDVLNIADIKKVLGISKKTAYYLISTGKIKHFRVGSHIKIPKVYFVDYVQAECYTFSAMGELLCQEGS